MDVIPDSDSLILTAQVSAGNLALAEVRGVDSGGQLERWLAPGVGLVALSADWDVIGQRFRAVPPVFCRHICPVQVRVQLRQNQGDLVNLSVIADRFEVIMDRDRSFSVQTRLFGDGWPYGRYDVNQGLSGALVKKGYALDVRQPAQVLSVVLTPGEGYLGLSGAADNLSNWAGGEQRFKREPAQVSRAEFKLLEAMECFDLCTPAGGTALDLGAAPGGWTRIVRARGMKVVAVDPADLDPRVTADPGVRHKRMTAETFLRRNRKVYGVILNDMRMDAVESTQIMLQAARYLVPGGWALLTLKLPKRGMGEVVAEALAVMGENYRVLGARQLFHNRSEVSVALRIL